jgi:GAF domain-containing protein
MPDSSNTATPAMDPEAGRLTPSRLEELRRLAILDSAPEKVYDDIVGLLARTFDAPIAMVNLLDEDRDWFKACVGLKQGQSPVATSFCEAFFRWSDDIVISEDTTLDPRFSKHALVTGPPHIRFYAAARLVVNGQTVGTLCSYDVAPKKMSVEQREQLWVLAQAAMKLLAKRITALPCGG